MVMNDNIIDLAVSKIKEIFKCTNCYYYCEENFRESYDGNGRITKNGNNKNYPKINRNNCSRKQELY